MALSGGQVQNSAPTYLVNQNLETATSGYDNGETWTEEGSGITHAYTGTVLRGTQSLRLLGSSLGIDSYTTFTSQSDASSFFDFRFHAGYPSGTNKQFFNLTSSDGSTWMVRADMDGSGNVYLYANGAQSSASATTLSIDTTYHVWLRFVSSGTCELAISTSTTKPSSDGSGNVYLTKTGASGTAGRVYCIQGSSGSTTPDFIYDHMLVSATTIGNNP